MDIDRISPTTSLLDEVFYKSSITDMREFYFSQTKEDKQWLLFSDYYLDDKNHDTKPNNVITFTAMPHIADLAILQEAIRTVAPTDIKHTKTINEEFINLINSIPAINIIFSFEKKKYYLWDTSDEVKLSMLQYIEVLKAYVTFWKEHQPERANRLDKLSKNIMCLENSLKAES